MASSTVTIYCDDIQNPPVIYYRTVQNGVPSEWILYVFGTALDVSSHRIELKGEYWGDYENPCHFVMTGSVKSGGDIRTLTGPEIKHTGYLKGLFKNNPSMKSAPRIPYTDLKEECFKEMFYNTGIKEAPHLPAMNLVRDCYASMFYNDSSLRKVSVGFTDWGDYSNSTPYGTAQWLCGEVAESGIFTAPVSLPKICDCEHDPWCTYDSSSTPGDESSGVTPPWPPESSSSIVPEDSSSTQSSSTESSSVGSSSSDGHRPLTFTFPNEASDIPYIVSLGRSDHGSVNNIFYRVVGKSDWASYHGESINVDPGDSVQFYNASNTLSYVDSSVGLIYYQFYFSGSPSVSGDVTSMVNYGPLSQYCFYRLFYNSAIKNTPDMPSTTLAQGCYYWMYWGCSELLSSSPLPASVVPAYGYYQMYGNCTKLQRAPELYATDISAQSCCERMFNGCSSLNYIKVLFTQWGSTERWVSNTALEGTFEKPCALPEEYGINKIPNGWTVVDDCSSSSGGIL